jgi:signal transduction histidine kinase
MPRCYPVIALRLGAALLLIIALTGTPPIAAQPTVQSNSGKRPSVVLLFSEDPTQPWTQQIAEGFAEVAMRDLNRPILYYEFLDAIRFGDERHLAALHDQLRDKYSHQKVDIVVASGEQAMTFAARYRDTLWSGSAVFFLASHEPDATILARLGEPAGLVMGDNLAATLGALKQILPETRRIVSLRSKSAVEDEYMQTMRGVVREAGLELVEIAGAAVPDVLSRVRSLPAGTLVFFFAPLVDSEGRDIPMLPLCHEITAAASVPTFMLSSYSMGCGVIGGVLRDFRIVGQRLATGALSAPEVNHRGAMLSTDAYTSTMFDARQLARWGIPESRLPPASIVLYRSPNLWRDYRSQVLLAIAALGLQFVLIAGLIYQRRRRRFAESASRRDLLVAARAARRTSMGELTASIAHELAQPLGAILHNVEAVKLMLGSARTPLPQIQEALDDIAQQDLRARDILVRIRMLVQKRDFAVSPIDVNTVVNECVQILAHDAASRGVSVRQQGAAAPCMVLGDRIHLQQVVLNLVLNAMDAMADTAASQRRIVLETVADGRGVALSVRDSGPGIAPDVVARLFEPFMTTKPDGLGIGLSIVRSIVDAHGGRINIENSADGGAIARVWLPCAAAAA